MNQAVSAVLRATRRRAPDMDAVDVTQTLWRG